MAKRIRVGTEVMAILTHHNNVVVYGTYLGTRAGWREVKLNEKSLFLSRQIWGYLVKVVNLFDDDEMRPYAPSLSEYMGNFFLRRVPLDMKVAKQLMEEKYGKS